MTTQRCGCCDGECPVHEGADCTAIATTTRYRGDTEGSMGTPMCEGCAYVARRYDGNWWTAEEIIENAG
jgi:hypothetical protein